MLIIKLCARIWLKGDFGMCAAVALSAVKRELVTADKRSSKIKKTLVFLG